MKKILAVLLVTCFTSISYAQRNKFELSVEGGPSFGMVYGKGAKQISKQLPMVGFETGVGLRFNTPKVAGIYTGIYVERKGFVWSMSAMNYSTGKQVNYRYNSEYHYVKIPVTLNLQAGKRAQFFVSMGGYVAALFRIHLHLKEMKIDNVNPGGYQYVDAGFCGGTGVRVPYKRWVFTLEARNSTGFLKVIKNTETKDAIFNTSSSLLIGLAYSFCPWKHKSR